MQLRDYQPDDLGAVTAHWNRSWAGAPRAFEITPEDFARRVLAMPTFEETTLLVVGEKASAGFVHFGPREEWGFRLEDRHGPNRSAGIVHALCADDGTARDLLLEAAETRLRAAGARTIYLWPTWANGTLAFYNGLTPSNEVSGQWSLSPMVGWAEEHGYTVARRYRLGELALRKEAAYPPVPEDAEPLIRDFPTPLLSGARRLSLRQRATGDEIGVIIYVGAEERNRLLGTRECAAFEVSVAAPYRGKGWGKAMMGEMARQALREGYTTMQLHVQEGNSAAENLYFRSIGFTPVPSFVTLEKKV